MIVGWYGYLPLKFHWAMTRCVRLTAEKPPKNHQKFGQISVFWKSEGWGMKRRWAKIKFPGLSGPYLTWKKLFSQQCIPLGVAGQSEPRCRQNQRNPGVWKIVYEFSTGIRLFYYKEFLPLFPAPVTFLYFNLENFLLHPICSPNIPLQKSHSPHFCQTNLYIFFLGSREIGCVTSLFWPTCDTLFLF